MAKYTELQTRKLISSYGGVGSIIETINGALRIKEFDKWTYFALFERGKLELEENEIINDDRLQTRLKYYFPNLNQIVKVPANTAFFHGSYPKSKAHIINAEYFPKWMYCNKCSSIKHIDDWYRGWKNVYYTKDINKINDSFSPPKCYKCYQKSKKTKAKRKYHVLEQVRFILSAPNSEIKDIPWYLWTNSSREQDENDGHVRIMFNGKCCNKQDLRYLKSNKFSDFSGVKIQCKNPECKTKGKQVTLAGLFSLRVPSYDKDGKEIMIKDRDGNIALGNKGNPLKVLFKPVIRTSNSVYYPLITNSLYLPSIIIKKETKDKIKTLYELADLNPEEIEKKINKTRLNKITVAQIKEIINPEDVEFIKEIDYRLKEYQYLTTHERSDSNDLIFERVTSKSLKEIGIKRILKINRLKLSSVQTGYSRQEPIDKDLFAENTMDDFIKVSRHTLKPKYTSTKGKGTSILPGIESYGEGVFIEFNQNDINDWYDKNVKNKNFSNRLNALISNAKNSEYHLTDEKEKILNNSDYLAKFIFIHTFSHILIKELEFLTGYPTTSISERLYVNNDEMQGLLIYTIAGAEGSFGGLVSQTEPERFKKIINSALTRAKDCASDPICYNSDGQGVGGLNLAACYSCSLLPETSCEEFNSYLDRAILIDQEFGFYKNI